MENLIKLENVKAFWTNNIESFDGEITKVENGSISIKDMNSEVIYWMPKRFAVCNPNIKIGHEVSVALVSDGTGHRVYVNDYPGYEKYYAELAR